MRKRIDSYLATWMARGYPDDIPDEVPLPLMREKLAPSYKAICFAILRNDHAMEALGFTAPVSKWYSTLKKIELDARPTKIGGQLRFRW